MKMKEICASTGLTDRAIRLYISEGLVMPHTETGYSGRSSIEFSDADLSLLTDIATLRRVGFSIADIRAMQNDPTLIPETVRRYRDSLTAEIAEKQKTAALIASVEESGIPDDFGSLAAALAESARQRELPKEDNRMTSKEKRRHFTRRLLLPLAALCVTVVGCFSVFRLMIQTILYGNGPGITILVGGGYRFENSFTPEWGVKCLAFLPAAVLMLAALVFEILYIAHAQKRAYLWCAAAASLLAPIALPLFQILGYNGGLIFETFLFLHFRFDYGMHLVNWNTKLFYLLIGRFFLEAFILLVAALIVMKIADKRDAAEETSDPFFTDGITL